MMIRPQILMTGGCVLMIMATGACQQIETIGDRVGLGGSTSAKASSDEASDATYSGGSIEVEPIESAELKVDGRSQWVSPASRSFVRLETMGSRVRLVHDGKSGPEFTKIESVTFSPDGKRLAYIGETADDVHVIVDGETVRSYAKDGQMPILLPPSKLYSGSKQAVQQQTASLLGGAKILFSPDGRHFAYVLAVVGHFNSYSNYTLVLNGKDAASAEGQSIGLLVFSPANELVYKTGGSYQSNISSMLSVGGNEGPRLNDLGDITFTADGESFHYHGKPSSDRQNQYFVNHELVVDLNAAPYNEPNLRFGELTYSSDFSRVGVTMYEAVNRGESQTYAVYVDNEKVGESAMKSCYVGPGDGLVYQRDDKRVMVNGEAQRDYTTVTNAAFSSDGARVLYIATSPAGTFVVDEKGNEFGPLRRVTDIGFSPNGKHSYFVAMTGSTESLFVNGEELVKTRQSVNWFEFDADGRTLRYEASAIDDEAAESAETAASAMGIKLINQPRGTGAVSPNGEYTAVMVGKNVPGQGRVYELRINGQPTGHSFDAQAVELGFDDKNVLHFVSQRNGQIVRVSYKP